MKFYTSLFIPTQYYFKHQPVTRKRVGITGTKGPARAHTEIFTEDGLTSIGEITSGGFGPSINKPIAMG